MSITAVQPISVTPRSNGTHTIRWDMDIETADHVLTLLGRTKTHPEGSNLAAILDPLYAAVSKVMDVAAQTAPGCSELWPDTRPMNIAEPAVLGNDTGNMLAVLIPGNPDYLDAIMTAIAVANEAGAQVDPADPTLIAEVQQSRWMVLNTCESTLHDFHPELAANGPHTPGAVLMTRVDLTHETTLMSH